MKTAKLWTGELINGHDISSKIPAGKRCIIISDEDGKVLYLIYVPTSEADAKLAEITARLNLVRPVANTGTDPQTQFNTILSQLSLDQSTQLLNSKVKAYLLRLEYDCVSGIRSIPTTEQIMTEIVTILKSNR